MGKREIIDPMPPFDVWLQARFPVEPVARKRHPALWLADVRKKYTRAYMRAYRERHRDRLRAQDKMNRANRKMRAALAGAYGI